MAGLRVRVLGGFSVDVDGRPVPDHDWRRNRARALVKLLAVAPEHRLHREQLMDALWPDLDGPSAGANLRKALHFARAAIGPTHLVAHAEIVALEATPLWVDTDAFEAEARAGHAGAALELYRGDLLPEDRFEPWADDLRERLRGRFHRVLLEGATAFEAVGDLELAAEALERLVTSDPLNEDAHLALMRVRARAGERHLAIRQYRSLETRLREELDVEPSAEVRDLLAAIVAGEQPPSEPATGPAAASPGRSSEPAEERRVVTVVWADAVHSGPGPEIARSRVAEWAQETTAAFESWGASAEVQPSGSVLAVFGVPVIHEDDASRALRSAIEIRDGSPGGARIGVATGDVIAVLGVHAGPRDVVGAAVVDASRLGEMASAGEIRVSARTLSAAATRGRFSVAPVGDGADAAAASWRLLGEDAGPETPRAAESPLVGRAAERATILDLVAGAISGRQPLGIVLIGAAGVRKSRLAREVAAAVVADLPGPARVLQGRCPPGRRAGSYSALVEILRDACGLSLGSSAAATQRRLRDTLSKLLTDLPPDDAAETTHALAKTAGIALPDNPFDGLAPGDVATRLGLAWPRFASSLAAAGPTLLVVDDLHWAGAEMVAMVEHVVRRSTGPLVVLITTRPDLREAQPDFAADDRFATIELRPLGEADSRRLIEAMPGVGGLDRSIRDELLARAEGNPFYLEQLAHHVSAAGSGGLPDTLQALLAARLDALPLGDRRLLQEAAAIGRTFWQEPLRIALGDERVGARLATLERKGFVVRRAASSLPGQSELAFRHALLHDVAYGSLPRSRRARAHARTGAWLEGLAGERSDELLDLLAHHFWSAISPAVDLAWDDRAAQEAARVRAFSLLVRAGDAARRQFVTDRAILLHERARSIAAGAAERMTALESLADDHAAGFHGDQAAETYRAALEVARRARDGEGRARLCRKLAWIMASNPGSFRISPDPARAEALVAEGLAAGPDEIERAWLLLAFGICARLYRGSEPFGQGTQADPRPIAERIAAVESAAAIGEARGRDDVVRAGRDALGMLLGVAGRYVDMLDLARRQVDDLRPEQSRLEQSDTIRRLATLRINMSAAFEDGLELGLRARDLGGESGPHQVMHNTWPVLAALFQLGRWEELLELLPEHITAFRIEPAKECQFVRDGPLIGATALTLLGRVAEAHELAALLGDPMADLPSASAWQARYATASGDPATARAISVEKAREGRTYGPEHAFALLEALSALGAWPEVAGFLEHARASANGNALLEPLADRVEGEIRLAAGDRSSAEPLLRRAANEFARRGALFEQARATELLAQALPAAASEAVRENARSLYQRIGISASGGAEVAAGS